LQVSTYTTDIIKSQLELTGPNRYIIAEQIIYLR
jgi:hypothetical protein